MREIGVRELKSSLSNVLHRVDEGERVRAIRRGRPVADIVPAGSGRTDRSMSMGELVGDGRITPAIRPRPDRPPRPSDTGKSASAVILAEREDES